MTEATDPWPGLAYGATESFLSSLQGISPTAVRTRFRKLRLRPFPDEIRSGSGVRVLYDLPRVLALAAVFELNRLFIPQGHACDLVELNWPEFARAFVTTAVDADLLKRPSAMPGDASPLIRILPDAYSDAFGPVVSGSVALPASEMLPALSVHAGRTVLGLMAVEGVDPVCLGEAFRRLELAFGWTHPATPHRTSVVEMHRGRGFLDEGPYLARAKMLLGADPSDFDEAACPERHASLVAAMRYLENPAPIDRWKNEISDHESRPRLGHLLNFWARENGLPVTSHYPFTLEGVEVRDAHAVATAYLEALTRHVDQVAAVTVGRESADD